MEYFKIGSSLEPKALSPDQLYLDPNNPRFKGEKNWTLHSDAKTTDRRVQEKIFSFLVKSKKYDISELRNSIIRVGFLRLDRIVVSQVADNAYVVLEGNRRVAAIKWILKDIEERNLVVADFVRDSLEEIRVLELNNADITPDELQKATWFLQGVRHISGIKPWGPYQQAELITQFKESGLTFTDAGQAVGVGPKKAGTMMRAYSALGQMKDDDEYSTYALPSLFSHFEQSFVKPNVKNWLKWDEDSQKYLNTNELHRFYDLITPDDDGNVDAKAADIRDKLPTVLDSSLATEQLMNGRDLDFCYSIAMSEKSSAPTWHAAVRDATRKIKAIPWSYDFTEDDFTLLHKLNSIVTELLKTKGQPVDE